MNFIPALQLVFITLKLAEIGEIATWSWWAVFSPVIFVFICLMMSDGRY